MIQVSPDTLGGGRSVSGHLERPKCVAPTRHTFAKNGLKWTFFWTNGPKTSIWPEIIFGSKFSPKCIYWLRNFVIRHFLWSNRLIRPFCGYLKIENFRKIFKKNPKISYQIWLDFFFSKIWKFFYLKRLTKNSTLRSQNDGPIHTQV